jgi:methylenetetrahydrofolate reductase (NADPH)
MTPQQPPEPGSGCSKPESMEQTVSADRRPSGVAARLHDAGTPRPAVSFELYPPKTDATRAALAQTITRLAVAAPDFFSVTYGASGGTRHVSHDVVRWILANTEADVVAHLTCIGLPWAEVRRVAEQFIDDGVRNLLALRGDPPADVPDWRPRPGGLVHASELVARLRDLGEERGVPLSIGVAATPTNRWAVPPEPPVPDDDDVLALLAKQRAGADYAITQVFFEAETYLRYRDAARAAGVTIPLLPGIVPLDNPARLRRMQAISGVPVPPSVLVRLDAAPDDAARCAEGRAMGAALVGEVLDAGAPGLHIYTFNQHAAALDLLEGAHLGGGGTAPALAGRPQDTAPVIRRDRHEPEPESP